LSIFIGLKGHRTPKLSKKTNLLAGFGKKLGKRICRKPKWKMNANHFHKWENQMTNMPAFLFYGFVNQYIIQNH